MFQFPSPLNEDHSGSLPHIHDWNWLQRIAGHLGKKHYEFEILVKQIKKKKIQTVILRECFCDQIKTIWCEAKESQHLWRVDTKKLTRALCHSIQKVWAIRAHVLCFHVLGNVQLDYTVLAFSFTGPYLAGYSSIPEFVLSVW